MLYLTEFRLPTQKEEEFFFTPPPLNPNYKTKNYRTVYDSKYPFHLFDFRELPTLELEEITVLCGNNGSGKSTILNVIAEKLALPRETPYNRSDFFDDYTELCSYTLDSDISPESCIITSDDVFDRVLDIRRLNRGIDSKREQLIREYVDEKGAAASGVKNTFTGMETYDEWKHRSDIRRRSSTQSQFIRQNLRRNVQERSNGESALAYFVDKIADGGLYLLDEPENSLSPSNVLQLKYFIEDAARNHGCQFIISTHSPFLLSLRHAKIYDLDATPITIARSWVELDCVRAYYDFFAEHRGEFE